jgi:protein phosphatase PTC1
LITHPEQPVPDLLNKTFHTVDSRLSKLAQAGKTQSGCTAVTAFLRVEQGDDHEGITNPNLKSRGLMEGKGVEELEAQTSLISETEGGSRGSEGESGTLGRKMSGRRIRDFVRGLTGHGNGSGGGAGGDEGYVPAQDQGGIVAAGAADGSKVEAIEVGNGDGKVWKRVLYTANVGDARAVLW